MKSLTMLFFLFRSLALPAGPVDPIHFETLPGSGNHSRGAVSLIFQDSRGFLWFATRDGLDRYDGYRFHSYKHEPFDPLSLSGGEITRIVEDQVNNLWMIVGGVLNRFDPKTERFHRYEQNTGGKGTLHSEPYVLYCDPGGVVWVGSTGTGVYRYERETDNFSQIRFDLENNGSPGANRVTALLRSSSGAMWIGTSGGGLNRFDPEKGTFQHFLDNTGDAFGVGIQHIPRNLQTPSMVEDEDGYLWVITFGGGLVRLHTITGSMRQYLHDPRNSKSLGSNMIRALYRDSRGGIWLATAAGGIDRLDPKSGRFHRFRETLGSGKRANMFRNMAVAEDADGNIWFNLEKAGLLLFDRAENGFKRHSGSPTGLDVQVTSLFFDHAGTLWVGTESGEINKYSKYKRKFFPFPLQPEAGRIITRTVIQSIFQDSGGDLWVGTSQEGLLRLDGVTGHLLRQYKARSSRFRGIAGNRVTAITEDGKGRIWVGTTNGLSVVDRKKGTVETFRKRSKKRDLASNHIVHLFRDRADRIWVGTTLSGLHYFDLSRKIFKRFDLPGGNKALRGSNLIRAVTEAEDGHYWISHQGQGLHLLDFHTGQVCTYAHEMDNPESLSHNEVTALLRDRRGALWVGTLGGGVNRLLSGTDRFQHFTRKKGGLSGNSVYGLLEDASGRIWLDLNTGLSVMDPENEMFRNYDPGDGLQVTSSEGNAFFRNGQDHFYYGGFGGFNAFSPGELRPNPHPPPLAITGFRKLGTSVSGLFEDGDVVNLNYDDTYFTLEFAALDFTYPAKNTYAFKLEGYDKNWIQGDTDRTASYTNLDGGFYTFRVKGANADGVWNEAGISIFLDIAPPFWKTWWFYSLETLLAAALIVGAFLFQRRRLYYQKLEAIRRLEFDRRVEELEYARKIQLSMLPQQELNHAGMEVFGKMRTATEVGGDYYDFFKLGDGRHGVAVGDATGHGLAAGLVVGMIKMGATVRAAHALHEPAEMVLELNRGLKQSLRERSMGMGLGLVVLDVPRRRAQLAFSGMPFPYHFRTGEKKLIPLVMKGPPLGFFKEITVRTTDIAFEGGDYLILLSDGFHERFDHKMVPWGRTALEHALIRICRFLPPAEEVALSLFEHCDAHAGGRNNDDDMTVVVVRMKESR